MSAADLEAYFRRSEEMHEAAEIGGGPPDPLPAYGLHDRRNLDLYNLMEMYKSYPQIAVFAQPVEQWSRSRHRDFIAIMLTKTRIKGDNDIIDTAWDAALTMKDPPEWS